ncbi:MAG TPA: LPS assembly lipoprotein LptE [Rhizomicrobium sp.]|jgi:LPS-assembly lipoprotein|nr:LPS assembly lipoprotein LptE [Rhizomicrobium sp.]
MTYKRIAVPALAVCALATTGCSFHPLFARNDANGGGPQVFNSIYVDPIVGERAAYELRDSLIDLLRGTSRQDQARYRLSIAMKQAIEGTAVQTNGYITRYSYNMIVDYHLSDAHTGAELTKGTETTVSGYDVVASPYATLVAQQDAQKFAAREIADRIRIDLGVYFAKQAGR